MKLTTRFPLLAGAALLVLLSHAVDTSAKDGEALFKAKCTGCHSAKKALAGVRKKPDAERAAHLDKFLSSHFAPNADERAAIAAYLVSAAAK